MAAPLIRRHLPGFIAGASVATLVGGAVAFAAIPSTTSGQITACVNKSTAAVRIIDHQAGKRCKSGERTISWSKGYRYRGAWAAGTPFAALDVVTYAGSSWLAKVPSTGRTPASGSAYWGLLAAQGATGPSGATGPTGPAGGTSMPAGYFRNSSGQSISNSAPFTVWSFTNPYNYSAGMFDPAQNTRIACTQSGQWLVDATVTWQFGTISSTGRATTTLGVFHLVDATEFSQPSESHRVDDAQVQSFTTPQGQQLSAIVTCNVGQYIKLFSNHNVGASQTASIDVRVRYLGTNAS